MKILKVIDFKRNVLGIIRQDSAGALQLQVGEEKYRQDLERFVQQIARQPVYLTGGEKIEKDGKVIFVTRRKQVRPADAEFFAGVQELLNTTRFGETRLRGLVVQEG
ncbi:MAG: hypothetical protein HZC40_04165 [Chloroflexi bacterium]|nr:hypothetical protein [Chloroflexota bacterium]